MLGYPAGRQKKDFWTINISAALGVPMSPGMAMAEL
jgi:hypothetical protein